MRDPEASTHCERPEGFARALTPPGMASLRPVGENWAELDIHLKWNVRSDPSLPAKRVLKVDHGVEAWEVLARRGTLSTGNKDLVAIVKGPGGSVDSIESLKQLVGDIGRKAEADRDWMKTVFLPHWCEQ
jgi:hypothetical protein